MPPLRPFCRAKCQRSKRAAGSCSRPWARAFQPRLEVLEERTLLNAADLDLSFGTNGKAIPSAGALYGMALQADHKIVAVGVTGGSSKQFEVVRLTNAGQLDSSFGTGGIVTTAFPSADAAEARGIAVQSDGKIVVVGTWSNSQFRGIAVARYNVDGTLDTSFGPSHTGLVTAGPVNGSATSVAIQNATGDIFVAGSVPEGGPAGDVSTAIVHLGSDGAYLGTLESDWVGKQSVANAIAIQSDQKIVVAGHAATSPQSDYLLYRATANLSSFDVTFNHTGYVLDTVADSYPGFGMDDARAMTIQSDGKIVIAGNALGTSGRSNVTVARYNTDGSLDTTFHGTGQLAFNIGNDDAAQSVAVQQDGKIVVAGIFGRPNAGFLIARLNSDGSFDNTFGDGGTTVVHVNPADDDENANAVQIQPDGKIVVGGVLSQSGSQSFGVIRLLGNTTTQILATVPPLALSENVPFAGQVATFTDTDGNTLPGAYSATLDWGDGNTSSGTVGSDGSGGFTISGGNTYGRPGNFDLSVTIGDQDGDSASASGGVTVLDAALSAAGVTLTDATDSQLAGGTVATFTDADPKPALANYRASIDWGDGNTSSGTIAADGHGGFAVSGSNVYVLQGRYTVNVAIADSGGSAASVRETINVVDPPISALFASFGGEDGTAVAGTVATFTDGDAHGSASQFSASIDWGDGSSATGQVADDGHGGFKVMGAHSYSVQGNYSVGVTIVDRGGAAAVSVGGTVSIVDPVPTAAFVPAVGTDTTGFVGTVAAFTDPDSRATASDFGAAISWGDGGSSAGVVSSDGHGGFTVSGSHAYAHIGGYSVAVAIHDKGGAAASVNGTLSIVDPPLAASFTPLRGTDGTPTAGVVATFTDGDPNGSAQNFSAAINWGDGSSSVGTIRSDGHGGYTISGTNTYQTARRYTLAVGVTDRGGATTSVGGDIVIDDAPLSAGAVSFKAGVNAPLYGVVAAFTDIDPRGRASDFTAAIAWGDGQTSVGSVTAGSGGFIVTGAVTYAAPGSYHLSVLVQDKEGASARAAGTVVIEPPLVVLGKRQDVSPGARFSTVVASFTGGDPASTVGDYRAAITWSDGTVTAGLVSANAVGGFDVSAARIAPPPGVSTFSVTVRDNEGGVGTANGTLDSTPAAQTVAVAYGGSTTQIFTVTNSKRLYRHVDATGWTFLGANIISIAAATEASGNAVLFAVTADRAFFRLDSQLGWQMLGAPGSVLSVTAGTDVNGLADAFVITALGDFAQFGSSSGWSIIGGRGSIFAASAAADDRVVVITADQRVAEFDLRAGWRLLSGQGYANSAAAVSEPSGRLVVLAGRLDGSLWWYDDSTGWTSVGPPASLNSVSAGTDRNGYADGFLVAPDKSVSKYQVTSGWRTLAPAGSVRALAAADDGRAVVVNSSAAVMVFDDLSGWIRLTADGFADG